MADYFSNLISGNSMGTQTSTPATYNQPIFSIKPYNPYPNLNLQPATPPTSLLTSQPVGTFGAASHTATTPTPVQTPTGGVTTSYGNTTTGPSTYSIDTSGTIPSSALAVNNTPKDVLDTRNQYANYVQGLAQAQQYSPEYLSAYQKSQDLAAQEAQLRGNLATGNVPGDTQNFAQGFTDRALMGADAQKTFADISLATQGLLREGNIAGAKALVDAYAPQSVSPGSSLVSPVTGQATYGGAGAYSDYQAQQTYFNLAQEFPDAKIPAYNPAVSAQENLQQAQQLASQAPSFQSRNLVPVSLPGGGYSFVNKNQIITGPNGQATIISSAQAAQADAAKSTINTLTQSRAATASALATADANFPLLLSAATKAGVNNSAPFLNQLQQAVARKAVSSDSIAVLNTLIPSLQSEYSRIIARGGTVDDNTRKSAQAIVDGSYSLNQLQAVYNTVQKEGQNVIGGYDSEIKNQTDALNKIYSSGSQQGSGGVAAGIGNSWANLVQ